ncbi:MAG: winged helix-turn-helix transcriptional regulator [bacterium]|nr:winged helix-turn-helix transcriptional regulator [bacterium]
MAASPKSAFPSKETVSHIATMLKAMGDPIRLKILYHLRQREYSVSELVEELGCSQANVSKHLAILKAAALVESRTDKQSRLYHVTDPVVDSVCDSVCGSVEKRFGKRKSQNRPTKAK